MKRILRIGTRESQLAVWQATLVQQQLNGQGIGSELVYIKSEGDIDLATPLYAMGVQGIFTKTLDAALLSHRIDIAVHSMKDVPIQLAQGIQEAAVLKRASHKDILVYKGDEETLFPRLGFVNAEWSTFNNQDPFAIGHPPLTIATSSIRRKAQWLHRYPGHLLENLRGNVNTRLQKLADHSWNGAIFAAAGLERIGLRPHNSIDLDWMLPAPAQGAIMVVCRQEDTESKQACDALNDAETALCAHIEKDFLRMLMGGCSTPIGALAEWKDDTVIFRGNILSPDGIQKKEIGLSAPAGQSAALGEQAALQLLEQGAGAIIEAIRDAGI